MMSRVLIVLTMLIMGCSRLVSQPVPVVAKKGISKGVKEFVVELGSKTVSLVGKRVDGSIRSYCTGVWVSADLIMTAGHCVVGKKEVMYVRREDVKGYLKNPAKYYSGKVIKLDEERDLGLIRVSSDDMVKEWSKIGVVGVGERVHSVSHPSGIYWSYSVGVVSGYHKDFLGLGNQLQVSMSLYYGSSGGGIFNDAGELVGIVSFMHKGVPLCVLASPWVNIRSML
jgi:S1-C subfamily serine protease